FPYLRKVTQLNVATMAALARAPMPPEPTIEGAVSTDTKVRWTAVNGAAGYVVRWRRTDANIWEESRRIADPQAMPAGQTRAICDGPMGTGQPPVCEISLPHVRVDDWVFGVSSVAADGSESPVASAVPGGAFRPVPPPAPAATPQ